MLPPGFLAYLMYEFVKNRVKFIRFMLMIPVPMFVIGEVYALVCWLIWLRKES